jgi:hypothetical protein
MWFRCGVDVWHLDCRFGGILDLEMGRVERGEHDYIAAVTRKGEKYELHIPPSYLKSFDSKDLLNKYLRALGLEEINLP